MNSITLNDFNIMQNLENGTYISTELAMLDNLFNYHHTIDNINRPIKTVKENKLIQWFTSIDEKINRFDDIVNKLM